MFQEKGIILKSAVSQNVKGIIALYEDSKKGVLRPLLKPLLLRVKSSHHKYNNPYKTWMDAIEIAGMISMLQRALVLMEEYYDGTLDLEDILAEDEHASNTVFTESIMHPTLENMFTPRDNPPKEKVPSESENKPEDDDPLF